MPDYKHAFQKGLEAHESSVRAKAETDQVFKEFAHEIHEASAGKITIQFLPRRSLGLHARLLTPPAEGNSARLDSRR